MPSMDRDQDSSVSSRDSELWLRHQSSASTDHGKSIVPMWDSSDPDRAPPPLPLNPASSPSIASRSSTSSAIQSAHAALTERARENFLALASPKSQVSPDRALAKGAAHRRMKSLQTGSVKDISNSFEGGHPMSPKPLEKALHRPTTPSGRDDIFDRKSPEKDPSRSTTPTPSLRPSLRRPPQSILGENIPPPSATMLALQAMSTKDIEISGPLTSITNGSNSLVRGSPTFDAISNQILSLTTIATALQREMAQLSRRSKDNATDLVSLKEATNLRDEDIRKSLRELVSSLSGVGSKSFRSITEKNTSTLDGNLHLSASSNWKQNPRLRQSFDDLLSTKGDYGEVFPVEGEEGEPAVSILDRISKEMGTKEGQEQLLSWISEMNNRLLQDGATTSQRLDDLAQLIRGEPSSKALMPHSAGSNSSGARNQVFSGATPRDVDCDRSRPGSMVSRVEHLLGAAGNKENLHDSGASGRSNVMSEETSRIMRTIKDSVAQGGGLTAEVKALVRELRGEVLGMGREIGRKLDQVNKNALTGRDEETNKEAMAAVVQDGLEDLKQHMQRIAHDSGLQSSVPVSSLSRAEGLEIYDTVKAAISDMYPAKEVLRRSDMLEAVEEAWENYKLQTGLSNFGLGRDEILATVKDGIREYFLHEDGRELGATRDEVFRAVVEGLEHFSLPKVDTDIGRLRDDLIDTVRDCLEGIDLQSMQSVRPLSVDLAKQDNNFVKAKTADESASAAFSEHISDRLEKTMETVRVQLSEMSSEAQANMHNHNSRTEKILDATKDGLEKLRADLEDYMNRACDIPERHDMLVNLRTEFAEMRTLLSTSLGTDGTNINRAEIITILKNGIADLRADFEKPRGSNESILSGTGEILDALHDGMRDLRSDVEKMGSKPVDMTVSYEILDALKSGIEHVRADIDQLRNHALSEPGVDTVANGAVVAAESIADTLKRNDIENLEVLITQLRIKVEALESIPAAPTPSFAGHLSKDDLAKVEETLQRVQESILGLPGHGLSENSDSVHKEDIDAIETLLRNIKAKIDELDPEQAVRKDQIDVMEEIIRETFKNMDDLKTQVETTSKREDLLILEAVVKEIAVGFEEMKAKVTDEAEDAEKATRLDIEAVEAVCLDIKTKLSQLDDSVASKDDTLNIIDTIKGLGDQIEVQAEVTVKAFEDRQAEIVGVGGRVTDVKEFLEEFRDAMKEKLDAGAAGMNSFNKLLECISDNVDLNSGNHEGIKELARAFKEEFDRSNAGVVGLKIDSDEKFQKLWDKFDEKFDDLALKHDGAQMDATSRATTSEEKLADAAAALLETKVIAEELKTMMDTLGSTLTESADRMDEVSKTVFNRVEETFTKVEETQVDSKADHHLTREQVLKNLSAIDTFQGQLGESQSKILDSIRDVLLIVGQHYDHSKSSTDSIHEKIVECAFVSPPPDRSLLNEPPRAGKHDDAALHERLDKVIEKIELSSRSSAESSMLANIQEIITATAADISSLLSSQTPSIIQNDDESKTRTEDLRHEIEHSTIQRDHIQAEIVGLREEESRLKESILKLRDDHDSLDRQKTRLAADVSILETALNIRREELHFMDERAAGLERRILEGVIDHSRALLLPISTKKTQNMSHKRVPSQAMSTANSTLSSSTLKSETSNSIHGAVGMVMNGHRGTPSVPRRSPAGASRRILSLSQISNNVTTGAFKRSHSVKTSGVEGVGLRKSSWGGKIAQKHYGELNKENLALKEDEDENESIVESKNFGNNRRQISGINDAGTEATESIIEDSEASESEEEAGIDNKFGKHMVVFEASGQTI